jgi:hypothetical protein
MGNGGSGGVRGGNSPPPPQSGEQIVRNLFEGEAQKKLDSRQQAQTLQEQSRQQQELRDAGGQGRAAGHEGEAHAEGTERGQAAAQARARGTEAGLVKEKEIDSFLSRASTQQAQREAGRQLSKPQTLGSINPQAWTVAGSPHTPDGARNILQNRQQAANTAHPQTQGSQAGQGQATARAPTGLPLPTFTRAGSPLPNLAPLVIRYGAPLSSGGEKSPQAFSGRPMSMEQFRGQVQRLVQEQLGRTAAQNLGKEPQVAVHLRGNVIFVRDGDKTRAFKLDKEGNLSELPSEDAGEQPLSAEAQKVLEKVLRQKGLQAKLSHHEAEHAGELSETQLGERLAEQRTQKGEGKHAELDFETRFALLLHEVLEEGRGLGEQLEGDPMFPDKKDWEAFFASLMKLGNQETAGKKSMEAMLGLIFRGLFQKKGKGGYLVGDLKFMQSGKETEEKFAQLPLGEKQLQELLHAFRPGQKMGKDLLAKLFGEEIDFLRMAHTEERSFNMASQAEKKVVFNPKASVDLYGQARLEKTILASRKEKSPFPVSGDGGSSSENSLSAPPRGVPANVFELLGMREKYQGQPRFYTLIFYTVFTALLGILVVLLTMGLFR